MAILMSIKPEYANKIFSGIKRYEFRKRIPKRPFERVYVYSSSPVKKIIGSFDVDYVLKGEPNELWNKTFKFAGIDALAYKQYFSNSEIGYAVHVYATKLFDMEFRLTVTSKTQLLCVFQKESLKLLSIIKSIIIPIFRLRRPKTW